MSLARVRKPSLIVLSLLLALVVLSLAPQPAAPASGGNAIALKAPSFVQVANAQEGTSAQDAPAAAPMGFPQDEAGIAAYFKSASPINLADVRGVYRVIEVQTADYIIGSVPVPDYLERFDVHLYVHRDGWFLAYYLAADPVSKIIDWRQYSSGNIRTTLARVLAISASAAGVALAKETYYDFRYPNATHLMLIIEDSADGNSFQIRLPGSYSFYARGWSLASSTSYRGNASWVLNGTVIQQNGSNYVVSEGSLSAGQLLPDTDHTIRVDVFDGSANAGLALVYRVP